MESDRTSLSPDVRKPGESREIIIIDRPSEFDAKFDAFVASMGPFKLVGVNFKSDPPPPSMRKLSKSARQAQRKRQKRQFQRRFQNENSFMVTNLADASRFQRQQRDWESGDQQSQQQQQQLNGMNDTEYAEYRQQTFDPITGDYISGQQQADGNNDDENDGGEQDGNWQPGECEEQDDEEREIDEEELCEWARKKNQELGKVALISISTLDGLTLLIRSCNFTGLPEKLEKFFQGKDYLKIGFGIQGDKHTVYEKYSFFVLNFVDPRRPLWSWKQFVDTYHFERFGAYSVASFLFGEEMQNVDAAACLSSMWSAAELNPYLKRAAARETQLTIDVYAEMCVQMSPTNQNRPFRYALSSTRVYEDPEFAKELLSVGEPHVNNGFNMREFGVKVFSTPALQRRFRHKLYSKAANGSTVGGEPIPPTFADRVRLRSTKSSVDKYWKSKILYAAFEAELFANTTLGPQQYVLRREVEGSLWEMKIDVTSKMPQSFDGYFYPANPALAHYREKADDDEEEGSSANGRRKSRALPLAKFQNTSKSGQSQSSTNPAVVRQISTNYRQQQRPIDQNPPQQNRVQIVHSCRSGEGPDLMIVPSSSSMPPQQQQHRQQNESVEQLIENDWRLKMSLMQQQQHQQQEDEQQMACAAASVNIGNSYENYDYQGQAVADPNGLMYGGYEFDPDQFMTSDQLTGRSDSVMAVMGDSSYAFDYSAWNVENEMSSYLDQPYSPEPPLLPSFEPAEPYGAMSMNPFASISRGRGHRSMIDEEQLQLQQQQVIPPMVMGKGRGHRSIFDYEPQRAVAPTTLGKGRGRHLVDESNHGIGADQLRHVGKGRGRPTMVTPDQSVSFYM